MLEFVQEFWDFLKHKKKLWLAPLLFLMLALGALLFFTQGSVIAPFIYTLF